MIFTACILIACAINLLTCRWGVGVSDTAVLTFELPENEAAGLFAAPWLEGRQLLATLSGVILPMFMIGLGVYFVARSDKSTAAA